MTSYAIPVDAFVIQSPLGSGGMGVVWRGVHARSGTPVAVKVVPLARALEERWVAAFRAEVEAVARVAHPGIIAVYDAGVLGEEAEHAGRDLPPWLALTAGSPYLAMELAEGGPLAGTHRPRDWTALKRALLELLDGLAAAHARGLVHRDLKPGNVLVCGSPAGAQALRISDFGLARLFAGGAGAARSETISGTPHYMAPEQIRGDLLDQGPETDLYALGCLAWELASGAPPFAGRSLVALHRAHLHLQPPPVPARFPVPDGWAAWLARLLQKDPRDRFRRAADAACALRALGEIPAPGGARAGAPAEAPAGAAGAAVVDLDALFARPAPATDGGRTTVAPATPTEAAAGWDGGDGGDGGAHDAEGTAVEPCPAGPPPFDAAWRALTDDRRAPRLIGAGLGLYGVRPVPMAGREDEREHLWQILGRVHQDRSVEAAVLGGAAGTGKSRLAEWTCERAEELGLAFAARAAHGPEDGATAGLGRLAARLLDCAGLSAPEGVRAVRDRLVRLGDADPWLAGALIRIVYGDSPTDGPGVEPPARLEGPSERRRAVATLLGLVGADRPLVVWLDDVPFGAESIHFVSSVLARPPARGRGILFVLTASDEALAEREVEAGLLAGVLAHPRVSRVPVGPLRPDEHARLVEDLLGLTGPLAAAVRERTRGNPLFAVQLVGDWVQRGRLVAGPRGFALREGEDGALPDDVRAVWSARVDRVVEGLPGAREALQAAAVLGQDVARDVWTPVCRSLGLGVPDALLPRLWGGRLAVREADGWSFVHGMLRETLEREAEEAGRLPRLHRACADVLAGLSSRPGAAVRERLGRHLLAAGEAEAALGPLLDGATERETAGDLRGAEWLLRLRARAVESLGMPDHDPRRARGAVREAWLLQSQGQYDEAERRAAEAEAVAGRACDLALRAEARRIRAALARERGDRAASEGLYGMAADDFGRAGDPTGRSTCVRGLGRLARQGGDLARARALYEEALALVEEGRDDAERATTLYGLGQLALQQGDFAAARAFMTETLALRERQGSRVQIADVCNALADLARITGDLVAAEDGYRRALTLYEGSGGEGGAVVRLNLGLALTARGEYAEARDTLESARRELEAAGRRPMLGAVLVQLLAPLAGLGDWKGWDACLERGSDLVGTTGIKDRDIAWAADRAADLAEAAGQPTRAARARAIAAAQRGGGA